MIFRCKSKINGYIKIFIEVNLPILMLRFHYNLIFKEFFIIKIFRNFYACARMNIRAQTMKMLLGSIETLIFYCFKNLKNTINMIPDSALVVEFEIFCVAQKREIFNILLNFGSNNQLMHIHDIFCTQIFCFDIYTKKTHVWFIFWKK